MKYVLSTMTMSVTYPFVEWAGIPHDTPVGNDGIPRFSMKAGAPVPVIKGKVTIRGGAGLRSLKSGFGERSEDYDGHPIWTARGFITPVSDENFEMLKNHPQFRRHLKAGLVEVVGAEFQHDHGKVAKAAASMNKTEHLLPKTPETFKSQVKVRESLAQEGSEFSL